MCCAMVTAITMDLCLWLARLKLRISCDCTYDLCLMQQFPCNQRFAEHEMRFGDRDGMSNKPQCASRTLPRTAKPSSRYSSGCRHSRHTPATALCRTWAWRVNTPASALQAILSTRKGRRSASAKPSASKSGVVSQNTTLRFGACLDENDRVRTQNSWISLPSPRQRHAVSVTA